MNGDTASLYFEKIQKSEILLFVDIVRIKVYWSKRLIQLCHQITSSWRAMDWTLYRSNTSVPIVQKSTDTKATFAVTEELSVGGSRRLSVPFAGVASITTQRSSVTLQPSMHFPFSYISLRENFTLIDSKI